MVKRTKKIESQVQGPIGSTKIEAKRKQNFGKFRQGSVFQEGTLTPEGKVKSKADGKTQIEDRAPDFTPIDKFVGENLGRAQGVEKQLLENIQKKRDKRQAIIDQEEAQFQADVQNPNPDRTVLGRIAQVGLLPATTIGNLSTSLLGAVTGQEFGKTSSAELSETIPGKGLGLATVAAGLAAAGALGLSFTAKAAQIGKPATIASSQFPALGLRTTSSRFATNTKTISLTKRIFSKAGLTIGATGILLSAIGTYPFAGFIKEEASQTTGIGFFQANSNDDLPGMAEAIDRQQEIVDAEKTIIDWVPFANVAKQLRNYFKSVRVKLASDKRIFAQKAIELEGGT